MECEVRPRSRLSGVTRSSRRLWAGRFSPPQLIALSFAAAILVGTLLLASPLTHEPGVRVSFLQALFTATSAACVTGLNVLDPGTTFNRAGEITIMLLIQLGGLGLLTFGTLFASLRGQRVGIEERLRTAQQVNVTEFASITRIVRGIVAFTLISEAVGTLLLMSRFVPRQGWADGTFSALFHAVSAFNNAGFALYPDNLIGFAQDPVVLLTTSALFILGGLGYLVLLSLALHAARPRRNPLSLNTRIIVLTTGALIVFGAVTVTALEWNNPGTLGPLSTGGKLLSGYYQGVAPRTAGFNSVDYAAMLPGTLFVTLLLMFVGGSPGSTAGGIKTTTFYVLLSSVWASVRGQPDNHAFGRRIEFDYLLRASVVAALSLVVVTSGLFLLLVTNSELRFVNLMFEAFSAFGTVGLSMNTTPQLNAAGQVIVILLMYLGRIGPLTFAIAFAQRPRRGVRYPADRSILIG